MTTVSEHYQAGHLKDAVDAAAQALKQKPLDIEARSLLCEMLCFTGDLPRVDSHLDMIAQQDARVVPAVSLFRQLVRAEQARQQFFAEGRVPEFLDQPDEEMSLRLQASIRLRDNMAAEAAALLDKAEELRPKIAGTCDGQAFDDFRDLDDLTASFLEVLTNNGKYYWVPVARIDSLEFAKPERPLDLIWRSAQIVVRGGPEGTVHIPVLYPGTAASEEDRLRLGRATEWRGGDGSPVRGVGQRTFLVGEQDRAILEIGKIEFRAQG